MVEKEGTDSEEEYKKAYRAARTDTDHAAEMAIGHKLSSSLIEKVLQLFSYIFNRQFFNLYRLATYLLLSF